VSGAAIAWQIQATTDDLDYTFDYGQAPWLPAGDAILSSVWTVSPAGPTLHNAGNDQRTATTWITGGTVGTTYTVSNTITTMNTPARGVTRSFQLQVV